MPATKTHVGPGEQGRELCLELLALQTQAVKLSAIVSELSSAHSYRWKWKIQKHFAINHVADGSVKVSFKAKGFLLSH